MTIGKAGPENVAVFGGSGFLGGSFVRLARRLAGVRPIVYSSKPAGSSAFGDLDVRSYQPDEVQDLTLDPNVDVVVNFAHPFERRGSRPGSEQIRRFARFIGRARAANPDLRLIHLSSMSVFEPFAHDHRFEESAPLQPPATDRYAQEKVLAETALRALPQADAWQLHLRPTVVYGPFCRPWTDRMLASFESGDVAYVDLTGRAQPVSGDDVSRFICDRVKDFRGGVYNLPGPETIDWHTFVDAFRRIVGRGALVQAPASAMAAAKGSDALHKRVIRRFSRLVSRPVPAPVTNPDFLCRPFFAEDRLVSDAKVHTDFPSFQPARFADALPMLAEYYGTEFRNARAR